MRSMELVGFIHVRGSAIEPVGEGFPRAAENTPARKGGHVYHYGNLNIVVNLCKMAY